jgi:hypothetical protein
MIYPPGPRRGKSYSFIIPEGKMIVFHGPEGTGDPIYSVSQAGGLAMSAALMQDIGGLIGTWQPRKTYHIGPNYLEDLKKFLQERMATPAKSFFASKKAGLEFVDGKGMDIGVKRRTGAQVEAVGIVMKRDLANLGDLRLVMEQIDHAGKEYQEIFVILMGTLTADMETKIGAFIANKGAGAKITVVKK